MPSIEWDENQYIAQCKATNGHVQADTQTDLEDKVAEFADDDSRRGAHGFTVLRKGWIDPITE